MSLTHTYLALSRARGLGPRKLKLLVDHFGSAEAVISAAREELLSVEGVGPSLARSVLEAKDSTWPEQELARAARLGVYILTYEDDRYPAALRAIYDPPSVLYMRGELPLKNGERAIGIVGTRDASDHALRFTENLARDLAQAGVLVVSGLALGVDSAAHQGAIGVAGGQTVAVLGSGVDIIYPRQNTMLAKTIWEGRGAVVSEYSLGTGPRASNFPGRNRIINGLSKGVVVVEAGQKSGALITAEYALEEGRTVFAVPGRVGDPKASGVLGLLKQGAVLVQSAEDILDEFGWTPAQAQAAKPRLDLTPEERMIIDLVAKLGTPLLDDLIVGTGLVAAQLLPQLMMLELKGALRTLPGGRYEVTALH